MKDISKEILSKIKKKDIKPKPKWHFLLKDSFVWGAFIFSILIGGIAVSVIFFQVMTNEWDIASRMTDSFAYFVLISLPYFWVLIMVGFSFLAYHYLRKTKKGYKYSVLFINIVSVSLSVILGAVLFLSGVSMEIHKTIHGKIPMYDRMMDMHHELLSNPDKGIVIGKIEKIRPNGIFNIVDEDETKWIVDASNAQRRFLDNAKVGDKAIVIGKKEGKTIRAEIIRSGERKDGRGVPFFDRFGPGGVGLDGPSGPMGGRRLPPMMQ